MFDLRTYSDEVFRVDEVLEKSLQKSLNFDTKFFYKNNDFNSNFLVNTFDIDIQDKNSKEVSELLIEPLKTHFLEGTKYSLQKALKAFFGDSEIFGWHEYNGKPYHFKVNLEATKTGLDENTLKRIDKIINDYKNVRSVLESVDIKLNTNCKEYNAATTISGENIEVLPFIYRNRQTTAKQNIGSSILIIETIQQNIKKVII